ncbi:site-specific integrase [Robertkochia marina]|uniref:Site-specific integrase n=1 Tax=Robertkochia marina TaxID=1227945 RepID=A0A4S3LZV8_9FLAO|nr:site-specific integrase [Robertkochia marina]THD66277.1 site-specific integrase [Robertkochia marina]TRZ41198.1 site-specific integrase [Robertkochia marina]
MKNTYSIRFIIRKNKLDKQGKCRIYQRITLNGQRIEISTQRKVNPNLWSSRNERVTGTQKENLQINAHLEQLIYQTNKYFQQLQDNGKPFTIHQLRKMVQNRAKPSKMILEIFREHNEQLKKLSGKGYAPATVIRYNTTKDHLSQFIEEEYGWQDMPVNEVDRAFIQRFEYFLKTRRNCNHNTSMKYVNNFKKIIRIAVANEWITKDPFYGYKISYQWKEREYLTQSELDALINKEITIPRIAQVRDMFVFCCYTGLAYADIKKLTRDHVVTGIDGDLWIRINRTKTESKSRIPLLPPALSIMDKYQDHPEVENGNCLIPVLTNQKANAYLKEIADLCGIKKRLTTHLARHTFATTVTLTNGVPIETVSKMLGHRDLRTTQIYAQVLDRKISEDMGVLKSKLVKKTKENQVSS